MQIVPAIDLKDGRCVRLVQGDPSRITVFSSDPVEVARHWIGEGAELIHVVDLDGALAGKPASPPHLEIAKKIVELGVSIEFGGGVRTFDQIEELLSAGVWTVVLGTAVLTDPKLLSESVGRWPGRIAVGVDARDGKVAVKGWQEITTVEAMELVATVSRQAIQRIIFTDVSRDGLMRGPNLDATKRVALASAVPVTASGGISTLDDVSAVAHLKEFGVDAMIIGRALYDGKFTLQQAIAAVTYGTTKITKNTK